MMLASLALLIFFVGGAVGSYAGVVAARGWHGSLGGRSRCGGCGRMLSWYELVPLISYVALRGRCRTCHQRVGWDVFAWEVGGGVVALAVALPLLLLYGLGNH